MPDLSLEKEILEDNNDFYIAGLDEAGRGAIAGPVVAAAVVLPLNETDKLTLLNEVDDSKRLNPTRREALYELIVQHAVAHGVGVSSAAEIDQYGIIEANAKAMAKAISELRVSPNFLLLDGRMRLKTLPLPQRSVIRGDAKSQTIAAASILAKVSRDRVMRELDQRFPAFGFAQHKGYCTAKHVAAIAENGICSEHRRTFAPIRRGLFE